MANKTQSTRLTAQHRENQGVIGIFGEEAKKHDQATNDISHLVICTLNIKYPQLNFRYRQSIEKKEINQSLQKLDPYLGQTLFWKTQVLSPMVVSLKWNTTMVNGASF